MIGEIGAALAAAKQVRDLFKEIESTKDAVASRDFLFKAQGVMLDMQESLFAAREGMDTLLKEKAELERTIVEMEQWLRTAAKYELAEWRSGVFAYKLRDSFVGEAGPAHWACPHCFVKRTIQYLQKPHESRTEVRCFGCSFSVHKRDSGAGVQVIRRSPRRRLADGL